MRLCRLVSVVTAIVVALAIPSLASAQMPPTPRRGVPFGAIDDAGITGGIGSRYFTVRNSAWVPSLRTAVAAPPAFTPADIALADATTAVPPRVDGIDLGRKAASLASLPVDADGAWRLELAKLQRLELMLGSDGAQGFNPADACQPTYEGYLVVNGELRPLPVGSSLD